ncbi:MAG: leucine-rich repeat protein, partial [Ruminococcus sp.]
VSDNNKNYISKDGILFNKEMTELLKYPQGKLETEYIISDSVSSIGSWAFDGCKNLKSITISDNVEKIGSFSFDDCTSLTEINVSDNNKNYIDTDGILFNKKMNELLKYPQEKPKTEYIIPDSVTNIESSAFSGCTGLTKVTIPNSVTRIAYEAFSGCTGLTSITIPDSVKSIESSAFSNCTGLTSIVIPDSITSIRNWAFDSCTNLKSITIPDSVTSIEMNAFSRCTGLTSITIPQSVISIGAWAFYGCTSLKSITIPDSVTSIGYSAFHYCKSLTSITIKNPECEIYDNSATISDTTTIYGYENSTAQAYAETYERNFVSLTEAPTVTLAGDANGDGTVDVADVVAISAYVGDSEKNPLDEQSILNGDVQNTGDGLTANDALMIQQYLSGTVSEL